MATTLQSLGFPANSFAQERRTAHLNVILLASPQKALILLSFIDTNQVTQRAGYRRQLTILMVVGIRVNCYSTTIGPAKQWNRMQWRQQLLDNSSHYKDTVDIIGIANNGLASVLRSTVLTDNQLQNISAQQYPYLQLRFRTINNSTFIPGQLKYWRVYYQKAPEAAINPNRFYQPANQANQGGAVTLGVGLENASDAKMDSVLIKFSVRDPTSTTHIYYARYKPMPGFGFDSVKFTLPVSSSNFHGINYMSVEANPSPGTNPNTDQLEQFHFNNYLQTNFQITSDSINPLLDVTYDGQHIMNGDIISSKPDILINLRDENKYLAL